MFGECPCGRTRVAGEFDTPQAVDMTLLGGDRFKTLATGASQTCGLTVYGNAYCWGAAGRLGDGASVTTDQSTPVAVDTSGIAGDPYFAKISTQGNGTTCVTSAQGNSYCWGGVAMVSWAMAVQMPTLMFRL